MSYCVLFEGCPKMCWSSLVLIFHCVQMHSLFIRYNGDKTQVASIKIAKSPGKPKVWNIYYPKFLRLGYKTDRINVTWLTHESGTVFWLGEIVGLNQSEVPLYPQHFCNKITKTSFPCCQWVVNEICNFSMIFILLLWLWYFIFISLLLVNEINTCIFIQGVNSLIHRIAASF